MQQFVVPQFIEVEDKVIGPITVRQFIIMLVGGGLVFVAYKLSDFTLFIIELIVIAVLTMAFAFIKVNGKPFHYLLLNLIQTLRRPRLRVWQRQVSAEEIKSFHQAAPVDVASVGTKIKNVRSSRLAELALIVDTGGVYQGETAKLSNQE